MISGRSHDHAGAQPRLALFGGSFDPPHAGHLAIAKAAADTLALDSVLFTPTGLQPLKPIGAFASYSDRLCMVQLLCAPEPRFTVSELDAPRADGRPNYTVNTLEELRILQPNARLFGIAGADSFLDMPGWHRSQDLLKLAEWIVVSRPGFSLPATAQGQPRKDIETRVHLLKNVHNTISATELRRKLAQGENCADAIPAPVMQYIRENNLYRPHALCPLL